MCGSLSGDRPGRVLRRVHEHVGEQVVHRAAHYLVHLGRAGQGTLLAELRVGAQQRERRAQLVARVGEEPAHLFLARLELVHAGLDAGQHPVERGAAEPASVCGPGWATTRAVGEIFQP